MLKVGLTGGIGSGKSTVARIFELLHVPVYFADEAAKRLMNEDEALKAAITLHFGPAAYKDGKLDKAYIASVVFADPSRLALLNSLVHPVTARDAAQWMESKRAPYVIKEAALIFESATRSGLDRVIGVWAPEALRISRVMKRDGTTKAEVVKRIKNQMDEEEKMRLCDDVIHNDEAHALIPQVLTLHERLLGEFS